MFHTYSTIVSVLARLILSLMVLFCATAISQAQQRDAHALPPAGALTLEQCIDIALSRNSDVLIAQGQAESAGASAFSAWSWVTPRLSATMFNGNQNIQGDRASIGDIQQPDGSIIRGEVTQPGRSLNSFSLGLNVNQTIYDGGASWNRIKQARQNARSSALSVDATESRVVMNLKRQYFSLLKAQRQYEVLDEQVNLSREQLRQSESMYRVGTVAKVDVLQARAQLGNARINLTNQATVVRQEKARLNNQLGRPSGAPIEIIDTVDTEVAELPASIRVDDAVRMAMDENPDIRDFSSRVRSAQLGSKIARGGLFPSINGFLSYSRNNSELSRVYSNFNQNWGVSFGVTMSLSLLNGTQTFGNISQAHADYYVAEENLERQRRTTVLAIEEAVASLEAAREVVALSQESIEAASESLRLEEQRYRVGTGRQLDVINAQLTLTQARFNLVSAIYDHKIAEASLDNAMGEPIR